MTARRPIPSHLQNRLLTAHHMTEANLNRHRLRAQDLHRIRLGMYALDPSHVSPADVALELARTIPDSAVFGVSAAQMWGMRLPGKLERNIWSHLARFGGRDRVRRRHVVGVKAHFLPGELTERDGALITTPQRTFLDLARILDLHDLVAVGDGLVCCHQHGILAGVPPMCTMEELKDLVERHRGERGVARARRALDRMRVGADSVMETKMRLLAEDHGICGWDLDVAVEVEGMLVQPDLMHRASQLFVQYEGQHHSDPRQVQRDIERHRRTESAGFLELRVYVKDLVTVDSWGQPITPRFIPLLRTAIAEASNAPRVHGARWMR